MVRILFSIIIGLSTIAAAQANDQFKNHIDCLNSLRPLIFTMPMKDETLFLPINGETLLLMNSRGIYKADFSKLSRGGFQGINTYYNAMISVPNAKKTHSLRYSDTYEGSGDYRYRVYLQDYDGPPEYLTATEYTTESSKQKVNQFITDLLKRVETQNDKMTQRVLSSDTFNINACLAIKDPVIQRLARNIAERPSKDQKHNPMNGLPVFSFE